MADSRALEIIRQGDYLYGKKLILNSLHQEISDNFYPERADFTIVRTLGTDFAANLTSSYPVLARRALAGLVSTMLRPNDQEWFEMGVMREDRIDKAGKEWLQRQTKAMKRAMYDPASKFVRATKEGDNDFVTFGQCVISTELNKLKNGLLYRCHHLRDATWCENNEGTVDTVHVKRKPTAITLKKDYKPDQLHPKVMEMLGSGKDPYFQFNVRNVVLPSDEYDTGSGPNNKSWKTKFVEITIDVDNEHIIEEVGVNFNKYSVPRWQTVSGSQYSYSMATVAALPDARLIQAITMTLLEAGEKAANPPMIAQLDVIRSDISIYAGGVTWVDSEYDERLGESMRPIPADYSHFPYGIELHDRVKAMIAEAFYLDKINLPQPGKEMTAYETAQRIKEYVRNALPIFEPMETEYNSSICQNTYSAMLQAGGFGSHFDIPQSLRGQDVQFSFENPLHHATDELKANAFLQSKELLAQAVAIDPSTAAMLDAKTALRDALRGAGAPETWIRADADMDKINKAAAAKAQQDQALETMQKGATVAATVAKASSDLQGGQGVEGLQPGSRYAGG